MDKIKATVVILTYNGEKYLADIFEALRTQKTDFKFETLVIDSGSRDATLAIIKEYQSKDNSIRLHEIPNSEFGHGKTRNLAAHLAEGELVAYLTHDAIPAHDHWLYEMARPFEINDRIVGVMGKQVPRPNCIPMLKSEINGVFNNFGPDFGTTIFYKDEFVQNQAVEDAISFYSDANSVARRSYLTNEMPYEDVSYAEDQLFGRAIINSGRYKVYAPRGAVIHSNDLLLREYRYRMFDETLGLRKIGVPVSAPSRKVITKMIVRGVLRDTRNICRDRDYSFNRKLYWLVVNPLFHVERWRGVRKAALLPLADKSTAEEQSLESRRKR